MGRTRRGFTPEYKHEAVKLVINTGRTVSTVAEFAKFDVQTFCHQRAVPGVHIVE